MLLRTDNYAGILDASQRERGENKDESTLSPELRMSHFCDAGGHPLSAAVTILRHNFATR